MFQAAKTVHFPLLASTSMCNLVRLGLMNDYFHNPLIIHSMKRLKKYRRIFTACLFFFPTNTKYFLFRQFWDG